MIFVINAIVLIWSLVKFRRLSQSDKAKAKGRYFVTNIINLVGIVASIVGIAWSTAVTPTVHPLENPSLYVPDNVHIFSIYVLIFCIVAAVIGALNIRKYSRKRGTLII